THERADTDGADNDPAVKRPTRDDARRGRFAAFEDGIAQRGDRRRSWRGMGHMTSNFSDFTPQARRKIHCMELSSAWRSVDCSRSTNSRTALQTPWWRWDAPGCQSSPAMMPPDLTLRFRSASSRAV